MEYKEAHKKILAARALLLEPTTSLEKFSSIRELIAGVHPGLDELLASSERELAMLEKMFNGAVIELSANHLPENTDEQKKRKKALLLFISSWNKLKSEVARVQAELAAANGTETPSTKRSHWGRIISLAKGPLGIITVVAVVAVVALQATSVQISIENKGCGTLQVYGSLPIPLPGFSLPKDPIPSGGSGVVTIPPLSVTVNGTKPGMLTLKALSFSATFELPSTLKSVTMDGAALLGKTTVISLSAKKLHALILTCAGG